MQSSLSTFVVSTSLPCLAENLTEQFNDALECVVAESYCELNCLHVPVSLVLASRTSSIETESTVYATNRRHR